MPLRLILVDDVPELRSVLGQALRLRGNFSIVGEAGNGEKAIALAREHQPDLIVLDLGLPDLAGQDVLTGLRDAAPDALVVVYSGSHTPERASIARSVEAYIDKSRDVSYVVDLLDEIGNRIPRTATTRIGPDVHEIALARRFVIDRSREWARASIADDAAVVVSELVANALVHVRSGCELTVGLRGDVLRIEVVDHGGGMPDLQDATLNDEHGRGLLLVSMLCTAWGTEPLDDGKSVWAELHAGPSTIDLGRSRSGASGAAGGGGGGAAVGDGVGGNGVNGAGVAAAN
ncbi:MAG TPA: response regulator [Acidimicrobiales bacterium]|nr:response regulator [Acidimicrobiales bacterium]